MKQIVPVNIGVSKGDFSKERPWAGAVDREYGEFYKKMNLNQKKVTKEAILFYNFWNIYRKLIFAISLVFFKNFRFQAYTQIATSAVMAVYLLSYWPCARYVDNVSKIINELTFMIQLIICAYLKEMSGNVNDYSQTLAPSANASVSGGIMIGVMGTNLVFHSARMIHNSIQAVQTIKMRRQQIASKWLGPPTANDPAYSPDATSGSESSSEEEEEYNPDDCPNLSKLQPPLEPQEQTLFNDRALTWPQPVEDELPRDSLGDGDVTSIEEIADIELLELPKIVVCDGNEPNLQLQVDDIWPSELKDFMASQPVTDTFLTIQVP